MIYLYDIEVIPNCFTAIFIEANQTSLIQEYIKADINNDAKAIGDILRRINKKVFIIYDMINDADKFYSFLSIKGNVFVSYNGLHYDDIMIDFFYKNYKNFKHASTKAITAEMKLMNDRVIEADSLWFETRNMLNIPYNRNYKSIDLMRLNYLYEPKISLKQISVNLKWYKLEEYHMSDYTIEQFTELYGDTDYTFEEVNNFKSFDKKLHSSEFIRFISYNYNDVFILNALLDVSKDELQSRILIEQQYQLQVLSEARSSVANKVVRNLYSKYTNLLPAEFETKRSWYKYINLSEILFDTISFKTKELQALLNDIKNTTIKPMDNSSNFERIINFKNKQYKMALGGLHSVDLGAVYESNDTYFILDADVNSYYPYGIVNYKVKPAHLSISFITILETWLKQRIHYKNIGDSANADIYKIFINAIYGKLGDSNSFLKDDRAMYTVTVNLQLFLLMLIEDLELNNFKCISANTDGVTAMVERSRVDEYYKILDNWSKVTKFTLEVNEYGIYVRSQVNAYIATIVSDGKVKKVKVKGEFDPERYKDLKKGYYAPIIAKSVYEYYINKTPIKETIFNHKEILDFCISQKTGGNFINELHYYKDNEAHIEKLSKTVRYYVSNDGGVLLKRDKNKNTLTNMLKGNSVTMLHKLTNKQFEDYNVNYNFYIAKAYDLIERITNVKTKVMKKTSGSLFNSLEDYE